jgi:hypothetical protein
MRSSILAFFLIALVASTAAAATIDPSAQLFPDQPVRDLWHIDWLSATAEPATVTATRGLVLQATAPQQGTAQPVHAAAIEHSDAYLMRAKIHRYASYATLPLLATELALGTAIYDGDSGWKKGMHAAVGSGIVGLFGVNAVTGVWNLFGESWNDAGRGRRLLHGLLMLAADAGFTATALSTPSEHRGLSFTADRATHRNLAITSIGLGTTGYLLMLLGN